MNAKEHDDDDSNDKPSEEDCIKILEDLDDSKKVCHDLPHETDDEKKV